MRSLAQLERLRRCIIAIKRFYFTKLWGMDIHSTALFSLSAHFDTTYPSGIHIGAETYVAFGAVILSHDGARNVYADTWVGRRCFIGARCIVLPGVRIGDECIVGTGSVVTKDVPPRSMVAGNPAKIIERNIELDELGILLRVRHSSMSGRQD
jgi:acetyltransferase-like isoleucine patch superfamily enzyme